MFWTWLSDNAQVLGTLVNFGMLLIWMVYLQLLLSGFLRQRRPMILIARGAGQNMNAHCLITNMSAGAIHVQSLVAVLHTADKVWACPVTDVESLKEQAADNVAEATREGPLASAQYMDIGTFDGLTKRIVSQHTRDEEEGAALGSEFHELEIFIIAIYGSENQMIGARRRFMLTGEGGQRKLAPTNVTTDQLRGWRQRRELRRMMKKYM